MAQQNINLGTVANDGTGDDLRTGGQKINANFTEVYTHANTVAGNPHSVTKSEVGLGNVDNTSDVNKPVSTAQQTALDLKANIESPTFTGTVGGITKSMVGLANVDNTSDATKNSGSIWLLSWRKKD